MIKRRHARGPFAAAIFVILCASCGGKKEKLAEADASTAATTPATAATAPAGSTVPVAAAAPAGSPPPDGKYERVMVDGVTVPMINVMNNGTVVLVDTDGAKPRSWEEQYKRKRGTLLTGQFDVHKTNTNKNDSFEDDTIDKEGLWIIDSKGNITKH